MKRITFTVHASSRIEMRCEEFGLEPEEGRRRCLETVTFGQALKKQGKIVYCKYYYDNLSVYVICKETSTVIRVITVIIKIGRM